MTLSIESLQETWHNLGYTWFDHGLSYNINMFGRRGPQRKPTHFDDQIGVAYRDDSGRWQLHIWSATTDPGVDALKHPINRAGTAILVPGQHRGAFRLGLHQERYPALVQAKPLPVFRDRNHDDTLDAHMDHIQTGWYGINIHRASANNATELIGPWSAGCQVLAGPGDFALLMALARESTRRYGPTISYTLI